MSKIHFNFVKANKLFNRLVIGFTTLFISTAWLFPLMAGHANAAGQMTFRVLTISSGVPGATGVQYSFSWKNVSTTQTKGLKFVACDTAVGTYGLDATSACASGAAATGLSFSSGPAAFVSQTGFADNANSFARDGTGNTYCTPAANVLCASRATATTLETTNTVHTITFSGVKNPTTTNYTFYVGVYTYALVTNAAALDSGTEASAVVQTLTINAAVAEILNFCVGATTVDNATSSPGADCSAISNTSVNIGTLDPSTTNLSPVSTNGGNSFNGVAMLRSNAINGSTISYDAIQDTGSNHLGTLRVLGATCSAASGPGTGSPPAASGPFTDQCIDAAGATQNTFTNGQEEFGMTVAGTNCGSVTSYSCVLNPTGSNNLKASSNYIGATATSYGTSAGFAWVEGGTATQIASSSTVVDDEALILKFAATPAITTPFGSYQVKTDFIAVPTF